ncbi:MAG: hypothetical protein ACI9MC_000938 [Kiritimatiellia bacterium]|jgi:hypothetical protein
MTLHLDVRNVYNNPQTGGVTYDYSESQSATGLPILPALAVQAAC